MKKYMVLDYETSGTTTFKRFCNPLDPRHSVTLIAYKIQGEDSNVIYNTDNYKRGFKQKNLFNNLPLDNISFLCGQNLKFDLLWAWGNKDLQRWIAKGGTVWDTQTVEYLLRGQLPDIKASAEGKTALALDSLALLYGGELKDDRIGVMFKKGILANEIDPELIIPYAKGDADNTNIVLQGQAKAAKKRNMLPLIKAYMDHYLALIEMEYNGMYIDQDQAHADKDRLEAEVERLVSDLTTFVYSRFEWPKEIDFNPASTDHISCILFGGGIPVKVDAPVLDDDGEKTYYKTGPRKGQLKTRKELIQVPFNGFKLHGLVYSWKKQGKNFFSSEEKILRNILDDVTDEGVHQFINKLLEYRGTLKLLTTYYYSVEYYKKTGEIKKKTGMIPLIHPHTGCIHSDFKTALTRTGRLSSRNPNIQNMPPEVLQIFSSRWKDDGVIVEFDYSQLEVIVQAYVTQSAQMIEDIKKGIDFHCLRLSYAVDRFYLEVKQLCDTDSDWKYKRKTIAKPISFQKAYGAMPESIARDTGIELETVKKVFQKEDERYPEINEYYELVLDNVMQTRKPLTTPIPIRDKQNQVTFTKDSETKAYGQYQSLTGKLYSFSEKAVLTKTKKVFRYFSMPDIQDYPIQGTAADIVACQVGKLFRALQPHRDKCLLINEVHDAVVLDVKKEHLDWTIEKVKSILEDVNSTFEEYFGCEFNVPIKVDYSYGSTWKEAKENE